MPEAYDGISADWQAFLLVVCVLTHIIIKTVLLLKSTQQHNLYQKSRCFLTSYLVSAVIPFATWRSLHNNHFAEKKNVTKIIETEFIKSLQYFLTLRCTLSDKVHLSISFKNI